MTNKQIPTLVAGLVKNQDSFDQLSSEDAQWAILDPIAAINLFVAAVKNRVKETARSILRHISGDEEIIVDACDGKETIAEASDVFTWGIDPDFQRWGTNVPGQATGPTRASVYEQVEHATYEQIFDSLGRDRDSSAWEQEQIINFIRKHQKWLRKEGWGTFFLFKANGEFFVAYVSVDAGGGPYADVDRFSRGGVWDAGRRYRVVVPQLKR